MEFDWNWIWLNYHLLDDVSGFIFAGAADDEVLGPVHELGGESVASARQFGADIRQLTAVVIRRR